MKSLFVLFLLFASYSLSNAQRIDTLVSAQESIVPRTGIGYATDAGLMLSKVTGHWRIEPGIDLSYAYDHSRDNSGNSFRRLSAGVFVGVFSNWQTFKGMEWYVGPRIGTRVYARSQSNAQGDVESGADYSFDGAAVGGFDYRIIPQVSVGGEATIHFWSSNFLYFNSITIGLGGGLVVRYYF